MDATPRRDAFSVLNSSAKRKRPNSQADSQASSFRTCPVCETAVPRALLQSHAENCKGALPSVKNTSACTPSRALSQQLAANTPQAAAIHETSQPTSTVPHQQPALPTPGNAFSVLMSEQRERSQVLVFFLEYLPDDSWQVHWWTKGSKTATPSTAHANSVSNPGSTATSAASMPSCQAVWSATTQVSACILQGMSSSSASAGKAKLTLEVQTNVPPGSEADLAQLTAGSLAPSTFKGSPSLLKSALQKNVRLCRAAPAVRCALQLMKDNPADFLRRVSIICYALGLSLASACLRIVHELASVPVRDAYPTQIDTPSNSEAGSHASISAKEEVMVRCILIRAAYGGMAGDVTMLKAFAATWKYRFFQGCACPHALPTENHEVAKVDEDKQLALDPCHTWLSYIQGTYSRLVMPPGGILAMAQSPLRRGDVPLSAVDFHISSIVEELMHIPSILAAAQSLEAQTDMHDSLRRAMWLFRSGLNSKTQVGTGSRLVGSHEKKTLQPLWQAAHAAADAWSADYIQRRFV
ncbi:MAG: hypothetical protein FRX49_10192 [Trebouxia sp. A1-2]|nr:MAG: hypothetical protein FRX49_10192 [Trebouxia sp. A1-2]